MEEEEEEEDEEDEEEAFTTYRGREENIVMTRGMSVQGSCS